MKKEKVILIILSTSIVILLGITLLQNKRLGQRDSEIIELKYKNTEVNKKFQELEQNFKYEINQANKYKRLYENYVDRIDSIYINALKDDNKAVLDYFANQYWKNKTKK